MYATVYIFIVINTSRNRNLRQAFKTFPRSLTRHANVLQSSRPTLIYVLQAKET